MILLLPILLVQCSLYYKVFKKESTYYTGQEKTILSETTGALGFGYGFDPSVKLDYIFTHAYSEAALKENEKKLNEIMKKYEPAAAISFYEKIYQLEQVTLFKMNEYKEDEDWKQYTYIEKYLLPPLQQYLGLLEKSVLSVSSDYGKVIDARKKEISDQVKKDLS